MNAQKEPQKNTPHRPTIGVLVDSIISGYQTTLWRALQHAAIQHDVNLLCFIGKEIDLQPGLVQQANTIYRLATANTLDGIIMLSGTIVRRIDVAQTEDFINQLRPLPIVSIAMEIEQVPSILLDDHQGIHDIMEHLINTHNCQKIGFIQGPEGHAGSDARFQAYKDALEKHNIPFDSNLVAKVPEGDVHEQAEDAIKLLYDERKASPEAIVVANDSLAIETLAELQARGISTPHDVIVTGFDNIERSRYANPPLTTASQPLQEQAYQALDLVLAAINGKTSPPKTTLSPNLIVRESCGCYQENLIRAAAPITILKPDANSIAECRGDILEHMRKDSGLEDTGLLNDFLDAFTTALEKGESRLYLDRFSQILKESSAQNEDISKWQSAISAFRQHILAFLSGKPELSLAENLIQQSRVMTAEVFRRVQENHILKIRRQQIAFRNLVQAINLATTTEALFEVVVRELPNLMIPEVTISLYPDQNPETDTFTLAAARTSDGEAQLPPSGLPYSSDLLLPPGFLPKDRRFTRIIKPLLSSGKQFGFITFDAGSPDESIYDALTEQISSGLQSTAMVQQIEQHSIQLQTASEVAHAASTILDPKELIHKIVNLIRERFDLYYVGLFLTDRERKWAVLRAGTGKPGREMLAKNWRLEIGGASMIGNCVATGKPDIQLDVEKAPIHLRNPHLPATKSELALPLISRGEILGALTIQSTLPQAFSPEDIAVLQAMADQIAVALSNARLFEQTQNALLETEALFNISQLASSTVGVDFALPQILELVLNTTRIDAGLFSIANPKTGELELSAAKLPDPLHDALLTQGLKGSLCELVYTRQAPIIIYNLHTDSPIDATGLIEQGFQSYQGVPIENQGVMLGTFCTLSKRTILPEDASVHLLRAVGQQVGFAIENSRLLQETQAALAEMEATQRRYQIQAWSTYNQRRNSSGYRKTTDGLEPLKRRPLPTVQDAVQKRKPVLTDENLTVPLMLRDQPIGAIGLQYDKKDRSWTQEEITFIQSIGEQFALAAETLRLLDETQQWAARERLVAEITTKLRASHDPQAILQTAAEELRIALSAKRVQALVKPVPEESKPETPDPQRGET